ncbi:alpha/beta fold hydrolase [Streptomyces sediminimaris]|uniref:alpha/beta fold hydrolase n=1 Tax=Streptomyces sediminimaris TaxID=3383721 RepID=UPI00399A9827
MPVLYVNGVELTYTVHGGGEPVVLVTGIGARARTWHAYQVPALVNAGYQVVTFDHRGTPPSEPCPDSLTLDDLVSDTEALIEELALGPCRVVGVSLGALVAQELALARADLFTQAVFMATRGRTDTLRAALTAAESELADRAVRLPPRYEAVVRAMQNLSRRSLDSPSLRDWLDLFESTAVDRGSSYRAQLQSTSIPDRLAAYRGIRVPSMVIAFQDDIITPPHLCREVAAAIPGCRYQELPDCGHLGHVEDAPAVNAALLDFFATPGTGVVRAVTPGEATSAAIPPPASGRCLGRPRGGV